jgi:hypothetical protein
MTVKQLYLNGTLYSGEEFVPEIAGAKEFWGL